jgi:hypothetical protein
LESEGEAVIFVTGIIDGFEVDGVFESVEAARVAGFTAKPKQVLCPDCETPLCDRALLLGSTFCCACEPLECPCLEKETKQ